MSLKEFKLTSLAVDNRKTVYLILFLITLAGIGAYFSMAKENFPEINMPEIYVGTAYPGNSPKVVEDKITRAFEKEVNTIKGVKEISSSSIHGYSSIRIEFQYDQDIDDALQRVKDAVDKAQGRKEFPQDLPMEPQIFKVELSEMPIMAINLSGDYTKDELKAIGDLMKDEIENINEINTVDIRGVQEKEMRINVDRDKMEAREISFYDIEQAVKKENITMSGGELLENGLRRTIRIDGEFKTAEDLKTVVIKQEGLNEVYLEDVAAVSFGDADTTSYARENGQPVVMLDVKKRSGQNLLDASQKVRSKVKEMQENGTIPSSLQVSFTNDQSRSVNSQLSNLINSIILGVILVVGVLLFFLGLRNAIFVGIAIPLSMFMSLMILESMGISLNVMVLFSLVLALGMLVDNGIVVVENVYRLKAEEGMDGIAAAKYGVGEIAWPIIASTATTLAAFIPLALWPGLMGEFMKYLPITLIIVLSSSLFVALVINPVLTAMYMTTGTDLPNKKKVLRNAAIMAALGILLFFVNKPVGNLLIFGGIFNVLYLYVLYPYSVKFQNEILPKLEEKYKNILQWSLKNSNPGRMVMGTFGLLIASIFVLALFTPKVEFFPNNEPNYLNVLLELPIGTDIAQTNEVAEEIESVIEEYLDTARVYKEDLNSPTFKENYGVKWENGDTIPFIEAVIAQVGEGTSDPNEGVSLGATPNKARITISFSEFPYRNGVSTNKVKEDLNRIFTNYFTADVRIVIGKEPAGPPQDPPINIEVEGGKNYDELIDEAERLRTFIVNQNIEGIESLKLDIDLGKPELPIEIDREKAGLFNLSTQVIAYNLRTALFGSEFSTYKKGKDNYDITLRYNKAYRDDLNALLDQKITFRDPSNGKISQVPIRSVIKTPKRSSTYSAIKRKDLKRLVTVKSNVLQGYNANEVVAEVKKALLDFEKEENFRFDFTGQQEEQAEQMAFLSKALLIAIFLIFLIIVTQFNSFSKPAIILSAVVLSLIGVFLGLVVFQSDFIIIMTMIGIISLAGVVVNNAIVLIDYTNLLRKRRRIELGLKDDEMLSMEEIKLAIIEAGKTRLRPVLLTAITTILGLLPMAIRLNIDFVSFLNNYSFQSYFGGDNGIFFGPIGEAIIYGLTFATFLTLVIVPLMYYLIEKFRFWLVEKHGYKFRSGL